MPCDQPEIPTAYPRLREARLRGEWAHGNQSDRISARCRRNLQRHDFVTAPSPGCRPAWRAVVTLAGCLPACQASRPAMKPANPPPPAALRPVRRDGDVAQPFARTGRRPRSAPAPRPRWAEPDPRRRTAAATKQVEPDSSGTADLRRRGAPATPGVWRLVTTGPYRCRRAARPAGQLCKEVAHICRLPAQAYGLLSAPVDTVHPSGGPGPARSGS